VADLHRNYRSAWVRFSLGRPSGTFPKLNFRKWLMVNFKFNFLPSIHVVDRYFRVVEPLGVINDGEGLDYFIPEEEEADLTVLPDFLQEGFIVVVIGGKHQTKIFPAEKVADVCRKLTDPVILLGGQEDRSGGEEVIRLSGGRIYNGCGEFSLNQAASLIRQAGSVMTNDTGMMHIAAAFSKKIVSVWGNTIPAFGMYPYLPSDAGHSSWIAEVKGLGCRPCSKLGFRECPRKHFRCMNDIDTDAIVNHL
jgi:ADP-heptose:LPS heptosyltransferase